MLTHSLLAFFAALVPQHTSNPPELGAVSFCTDFDAGLKEARASAKPVFLLFDEIPGCDTCKGFGAGPLSHPLLVEAIETEFVPIAIHNNRPGRDAELLRRFDEPAWNNPVVRFVDPDGNDLIPRADGVWTTGGIATRMVAALEAAHRPVPAWLALVVEETDPAPTARATFAMHCYWEGQAALGGLAGVALVTPGAIDGNEVVEVRYRPDRLALADLVKTADQLDCAAHVYLASETDAEVARAIVGDRARVGGTLAPAPATEVLYHLLHSHLRYLPLTGLQATRINSDLGLSKDAARWLTPRQQALLTKIERRLRDDPNAFVGLDRPAHAAELAEYTRRLVARL